MSLPLRVVRFRTTAFFFVPYTVIHINTPYCILIKTFAFFLLLFVLPRALNCDAAKDPFFRNLVELTLHVFANKSLQEKVSALQAFLRKPGNCKPILVFLCNTVLLHVGLRIRNEPLVFNQPVVSRPEYSTHSTECFWQGHPWNSSFTRELLLWETNKCTRFRKVKGHIIANYVPSVSTLDRSQRVCLRPTAARLEGRVTEHTTHDPRPKDAYVHPLTHLRSFCDRSGRSCSQLQNATTWNSLTWILLNSPSKAYGLSLPGNIRPGMTCIREMTHAVADRLNTDEIAKRALAAELFVKYSVCVQAGRTVRVKGSWVPHLIINCFCVLGVIIVNWMHRKPLHNGERLDGLDLEEETKWSIEEIITLLSPGL